MARQWNTSRPRKKIIYSFRKKCYCDHSLMIKCLSVSLRSHYNTDILTELVECPVWNFLWVYFHVVGKELKKFLTLKVFIAYTLEFVVDWRNLVATSYIQTYTHKNVTLWWLTFISGRDIMSLTESRIAWATLLKSGC